MPFIVSSGSQVKCSMGTTPAVITASPSPVATATPTCTIMDFAPNNIPTFGMCISLANPQVAIATAAAKVLTPQPCIPKIVSPWAPGSMSTMIGGMKALTNESTCACTWAGAITVVAPSQEFVQST